MTHNNCHSKATLTRGGNDITRADTALTRAPIGLTRYATALALAGALAGCATAGPTRTPASATIVDATGGTIGIAYFTENSDRSVTVRLEARNLQPGPHGIHFHSVGVCDRPAFNTAGPHFNAGSRAHGLENPAGPHNGDLPNLIADQTGRASYRATTNRVTLSAGPYSLLDANLSALVIHSAPDDQRTDPSGNSGPRVGCGIVLIPQG